MELDGGLRSLSFLPDFSQVRAVVLGRYATNAGVTREQLAALVGGIPALRHLPVIGNCDFGHTTPVLTLPIGGRCKLQVTGGKTRITLTEH
jgi:muramoyltetrapeptide carboxypeptidase